MKQNVWVIGGTSGIGQAIAEWRDRNHDVTIVTDKNVDVRDRKALDNFWDRQEKYYDPVDGVVFCAGVNYLEWLGEMREAGMADIQRVMDTNVVGFINVMDMLSSRVTSGEFMDVVAIGSDAAWRPMRTSIGYCASKAALHMAVQCAAREVGPRGWRVNCVAPGMTADTGMTKYVDLRVPALRNWTIEGTMEYEMQQSVLKRRVSPWEIAQVVWDVLDGPAMLNGAIIPVNGGR